jgi:hypothetical protein
MLAACGGETATQTPDVPQSTPTAAQIEHGFPPGIEDDGPSSRPAESDEFGGWQVMEIRGTSVEIPYGENWIVQGNGDPCYGDGRFYLLLEDKRTGDRIRVDMVNPKATTHSADPARLEALAERILRSITGNHTPPASVRELGPLPTLTTCSSEIPGEVPTLIIDTFTPPVADSTRPPEDNSGGSAPDGAVTQAGSEEVR